MSPDNSPITSAEANTKTKKTLTDKQRKLKNKLERKRRKLGRK